MNNEEIIVNILELLNGLPFKVVSKYGMSIIFVKSNNKLEIIVVGNDTVRVTLPYLDDKVENSSNLNKALFGLGIDISELDVKSSVEQQLFREMKYHSLPSSESAKEMSLRYQIGYRTVLDSIFKYCVA